MALFHRTMPSPVGTLHLVGTETHLTGLYFDVRWSPTRVDGPLIEADAGPLVAAGRQLADYFAGRLRRFDLPIQLRGSEFQRRVWMALSGIPTGETWSYGRLAEQVGAPSAVRAVGRTNGLNPISLVLPCHRVVGADGSLTGYAGGLPAKRFLLELEGALPPVLPLLPADA